jgi:branched-subunit amino acid transport protein
VNLGLVGLAILMALVTYPSRALPLLTPGMERLPPRALEYLRLVGPSVLATLAAVSIAVVIRPGDGPSLHVGVEWLAVGVCVALVVWRRVLLLGLLGAVVVAAGLRAMGLG